jgi:putative membrane-bound dehydrogenase-like protein
MVNSRSLLHVNQTMKSVRAIVGLAMLVASGVSGATDSDPLEFPPPKSPQESLAVMQTKPGLQIELVAAEPLIVDPVAIDWGPDGKLWVVEMRDYPIGMDGNYKPGSRIKVLESTKGDGKYDKATVFLDNLPFVTGVTAWRKGALICAAPDILYAEDTDGDGKADVVKKLFTGFETGNYQARVNSLSLGLDNWIYGANGLLGGIIRGQARALPESLKSKVEGLKSSDEKVISVDIRGRDFRMNPDTGEFEPASGLTQQGRVRDDRGNWFGCDNSTAAWHYPIPDHYLRRNPYVAAPNPRVALAAGVDGNLLFPISHTLERFNNPGAVNRVTSGCGIGIYRDELLGAEYYGNAFVCEPVHNLVHRMVLKPSGLTFSAVRAADEQHSEFLASRDNWFRPVQMRTGPDGAIWVADMYRFVIEHPRWIPPERLTKLDVRAGDDKGRIFRVYPKGATLHPIPDLTRVSRVKLAAMLDTPNGTERDRVQQELVFGGGDGPGREKADIKTVADLDKLAHTSKNPAVRLQALCVLDGLGALTPENVGNALVDPDPAVCANGIRLTEKLIQFPEDGMSFGRLESNLFSLTGSTELAVRYQLALTLGERTDPRAGEALGELAVRDMDDEWMRAAILCSATRKTTEILKAVFGADVGTTERSAMISRLIATAAGGGTTNSLSGVIALIAPADKERVQEWQPGALGSLLDALERKNLALSAVCRNDEEARLDLIFDWAASLAPDSNAKASAREAAIRLLGRRPEHRAVELELLSQLLVPDVPASLQKTALDMLKHNRSPEVGKLLLSAWPRLPFALRPGVIEVLISREESTRDLLAAVESGQVGGGELPLANRQLLLKSSNHEIKLMAQRIWKSDSTARAEVVKKYHVALSLPGDPVKGRVVWSKNCMVCHYFRGEGAGVGPNLGALTDKSPADFLTAILDPNAAVEPRFIAYNVQTKDDRFLTGVIGAETATTLTLVQAGGTSEKLLRSDISEIRASGLSLMPEGLEQNISPQDLANLIAYLNSAPHPLGSATAAQAEAAKKRFLTDGTNEVSRIIEANAREPHASWMGELPLAVCAGRLPGSPARLAWETSPVPGELKPTDVHEFRLPVSVGHRGNQAGKFSLRLNARPVLDFGVALHDQSWQSTDGSVRMSYLVMEDSVQESNGILTITVPAALLQPEKPAAFEVTSPSPNNGIWFGVYLVGLGESHAAR